MKQGLFCATFGNPHEIGGWAIETIRRPTQTEDHKEGIASLSRLRSATNRFSLAFSPSS
jgi:hypothetical protein